MPAVAGRPTEVEVRTPRTLLVPAELFDGAHAAALLAAGGVPALDDDEIVWSDPAAEIVAVMAAGREAILRVRSVLGNGVRFTAPLLPLLHADRPTVRICSAPGILYLSVFDTEPLLAEAIPVLSDEDILCLFERLGERFRWADFTLLAAGGDANRLRKLLKNRFKESLCES